MKGLTLEDFDHVAGGIGVDRFAVGDGFEQEEKTVRGGGVAEALFEGFAVFHAAQYFHFVGVEGVHRGADIFDAKFFDEEIGGEIAAFGDHQFAELCEGLRLAFEFVESVVGIVGGVEFVDRAIDDAVKFVSDRKWIVEFQLPFPSLVEEFDHDRNFHGAGGMKGFVIAGEPLSFSVESAKSDRHIGAAFLDSGLDDGNRLGELRILCVSAVRA